MFREWLEERDVSKDPSATAESFEAEFEEGLQSLPDVMMVPGQKAALLNQVREQISAALRPEVNETGLSGSVTGVDRSGNAESLATARSPAVAATADEPQAAADRGTVASDATRRVVSEWLPR